jgi:zinc protease
MVGYHLPAGSHPDFVPLQIATAALTNAPSGRLYRALVESGLAAQVASQELQLKDPGMLIVSAAIAPDKSVDAARAALLETLADLEQNPLTDEEVERSKNRAISFVEQALNNSQSVALELSNWVAIGDWRMLFLDRDRVRNVTLDDVRRATSTYLKPTNRTVGVFLPDPAPNRVVIPPKPDLTALLEGYTGDPTRAAGEAFEPTPANIQARTQTVTLPSGAELAMLPKETRGDVVNATIRLNFGTEESLEGTSIVGPLVGQMLMRGTQSLTRQEIQDELDRRQSRLGIGANSGVLVASLQTTREHLLPMLELAIQVLREPAFPPGELETLRAAAIANMESQRSEPQSIVQRAFARHWSQHYAPGSMHYVPTVDEQLAGLRAVTVGDLAAYHDRFVGASHAEIAIVGDFDAAPAAALLAEALGDWQSPLPYEEIVNPYPEPPIAPVDRAFETPDKENAFLMAGMPIRVGDESPDYPALVLGNYILGQGTNSRLFSRIRGTEGLSYSVGSSLTAQSDVEAGTFVANAIAAPQNVERVEASLRDELQSVVTEGYAADEVAAAIESWTLARQVSRSQDSAIVSLLLRNLHEDRTMAWDEDLERRVRELTPASIREAMSRHIDVGDMAFMTGGDFAGAGN